MSSKFKQKSILESDTLHAMMMGDVEQRFMMDLVRQFELRDALIKNQKEVIQAYKDLISGIMCDKGDCKNELMCERYGCKIVVDRIKRFDSERRGAIHVKAQSK